ncbi:glycosyltransferase family 4 protein [Phocaeicola plebeius]|jgi:glycosyltransferase involved in cell wall biosynthesis|uniref:glycosyltransferase family 4 protein n=1 Tax=Phocaeicola plebeius TaxID=310297 RepID=UPI000E4F4E77|nr:glycosyltransferase family 4 protein [Phocaeicola plebeius]MBS4810956.1 glycosyltransferase family 4 protein [Bacteroides sp.]MBS4825876.1 glycosyltransferase family 4 protein [Bacteroides sp.]RHA26821.1 glycosyltransferase family 4 protein [Phocaeicola plebeius]RHA29287.1 glycosyltransferase family 4 protein [Phocaeicola plebeius]
MKIIYCTHSTCNPGGMERVLLNKVTYLSQLPGWKVAVVTTDQHQRPPFYPFPEKVRMTDLGINYSEDNGKGAWKKITGYLRKRKEHKRKLTALLLKEKPDIVVSLYPSESSFIPDIKDGSKKVLELHYCKFFRLQYGRKGLLGWIDKLRTRQDEQIVRRFDKFVVLTNEDRGYWGNLPNIEVIPNAAMHVSDAYSDVMNKRVIAVGRLDYQKGFDRLVQAWQLVRHTGKFTDWKLDIFGQGEWREMLQQMIDKAELQDSVRLNRPTKQIGEEYVKSDMLVMSSNYEGFPMVMIEAMACGLPVVSFDYKCGPKDIIQPGINGLLVPNGDIQALADAMMKVMEDEAYRKMLSLNARKVVDTYSEQAVMSQWIRLFTSITAK